MARTGEPLAFESFVPQLKRCFHISVNSPRPGYFATIFEDITGRKQQERELQEKNAELERFNYTISHDLKSPLVTVKTFMGYLEQDVARADQARVAQDLMYMRVAVDRMGRLFDELLDLSRLGRVVNPPVEVSFRELAQEAIHLVAGPISEHRVEVRLAEAPVTLYGDRPRLVAIWQNLIENAVKFMSDQVAPFIEVGVEKRGEETVFYVRDNGMGIDPRYREKIFGLFERLDQGAEGTGIGLAMVKRIVETYEGAIWVESEGIGKGTTFRFTMPKALQMERRGEGA